MSDNITQMRLSMRLDAYLKNYSEKQVRDHPSRGEWDHVWRVANLARTNNTLTPQIVDDVRIVLNKL